MLTKVRYRSLGRRASGWCILVFGGLAGCLIGYVLAPSISSPELRADPEGSGPFAITMPAPALLDPGEAMQSLVEMQIEIGAVGVRVIKAARERALSAGIIETLPGDTVSAIVSADGKSVDAKIRLKGDWTDHVQTAKWSMRIELDGDTLFGMSRFSVQSPSTRGLLVEWVAMELARREGILAPRTHYVRVTINGRPSGIYYLEEHFTKEMLESQGRRDGPIVRLSEETLWSSWLQYGRARGSTIPEPAIFASSYLGAEVAGFDEKRIASTAQLNRRLSSALEKMRDLQRLILAHSTNFASGRAVGELERLSAMESLQGRTIDELFEARKIGRWLALYCLLNAAHGSRWIQWRFYHDPVLDRLEPIVFDTGALAGDLSLAKLMRSPLIKEFLRSEACYEELVGSLLRFTQPDYLTAFFTEIGPDLRRYADAMKEEMDTPSAGLDIPQIILDAMLPIAASYRESLTPEDPIQFDCRLLPASKASGLGEIVIESWATTWTPVLVDGFEFSNGRVISAASVIDASAGHLRREQGRVLLPHQGARQFFRLPVDRRLAGLRDIEAVKESARTGDDVDRVVRLKLKAIYRLVGSEQTQTEKLLIRRVPEGGRLAGRPEPPSLEQSLQKHRCLGYEWQEDRLFLRPGTWNVDGDLIIPGGHVLTAGAGTTLLFAEGAIFSSGAPIDFAGSKERPIVLVPQDAVRGWGGLLVHGCRERSRLSHVVIQGCVGIDRGSWQSPGGTSFYRAPVSIVDSRFEDSRAEDALNVVSSEIELVRVKFHGGVSDLFDGDFITGTIRDCEFVDTAGDGIDASASHLQIESVSMQRIGDKAISAGEGSNLRVEGCTIEGASIGIAAKDLSTVQVSDLEASDIGRYLLAAYVKKLEYGPASIVMVNAPSSADEVGSCLVQTGCRIEIDGRALPTQDIDVADLYRRKILGK